MLYIFHGSNKVPSLLSYFCLRWLGKCDPKFDGKLTTTSRWIARKIKNKTTIPNIDAYFYLYYVHFPSLLQLKIKFASGERYSLNYDWHMEHINPLGTFHKFQKDVQLKRLLVFGSNPYNTLDSDLWWTLLRLKRTAIRSTRQIKKKIDPLIHQSVSHTCMQFCT